MLVNMGISMLLQMLVIISIIPRFFFKSTIIVVNLVIELVEGLSAMLDIVKALLGAMEGYTADIPYVMTLNIKGSHDSKGQIQLANYISSC